MITAAGPSALPLPSLTFVDDGSREDALAGDGTYTALLPITAEQPPGLVNLTARVRLANRHDEPSTIRLARRLAN